MTRIIEEKQNLFFGLTFLPPLHSFIRPILYVAIAALIMYAFNTIHFIVMIHFLFCERWSWNPRLGTLLFKPLKNGIELMRKISHEASELSR
jgi:hypothetical protein